MTYWFISFLWRRDRDTSWTPGEATISDEHPIRYIRRLRAHNQNSVFKLMFFAEVPPEIYELSRS